MYIFGDIINCKSCKFGYIIDDIGYHSICGKGNCYLCQEQQGGCEDYEKGNIPENKYKIS